MVTVVHLPWAARLPGVAAIISIPRMQVNSRHLRLGPRGDGGTPFRASAGSPWRSSATGDGDVSAVF